MAIAWRLCNDDHSMMTRNDDHGMITLEWSCWNDGTKTTVSRQRPTMPEWQRLLDNSTRALGWRNDYSGMTMTNKMNWKVTCDCQVHLFAVPLVQSSTNHLENTWVGVQGCYVMLTLVFPSFMCTIGVDYIVHPAMAPRILESNLKGLDFEQCSCWKQLQAPEVALSVLNITLLSERFSLLCC